MSRHVRSPKVARHSFLVTNQKQILLQRNLRVCCSAIQAIKYANYLNSKTVARNGTERKLNTREECTKTPNASKVYSDKQIKKFPSSKICHAIRYWQIKKVKENRIRDGGASLFQGTTFVHFVCKQPREKKIVVVEWKKAAISANGFWMLITKLSCMLCKTTNDTTCFCLLLNNHKRSSRNYLEKWKRTWAWKYYHCLLGVGIVKMCSKTNGVFACTTLCCVSYAMITLCNILFFDWNSSQADLMIIKQN